MTQRMRASLDRNLKSRVGMRFAPIAGALLFIALASRLYEVVPLLRALRPTVLTLLAAIALLSIGPLSATLRSLLKEPIVRGFIGYYVAMILSLIPSIWFSNSMGAVTNFSLACVLFFALAMVEPKPAASRLLERICVGSVGVYSLLFLLFASEGYGGGRWAIFGTSYDPNDAAAVCVSFLPFLIMYAIRDRGLLRFAWLALALMDLAVIGRSGSRGAAVALAVCVVVLIGGFRGRRFALGVFLSIVLAIGAWSVAPPVFRARIITTFFSEEETYDSTSYVGRKNIWARGLTYLAERPVLGVGAANYTTREGIQADGGAGGWFTAHNTYLQVAVELGFVGLTAYWVMLWGVTKIALSSYRSRISMLKGFHRPELLASVAAFATASTFLSHAYSFYVFALFALVLNYGRVLGFARLKNEHASFEEQKGASLRCISRRQHYQRVLPDQRR